MTDSPGLKVLTRSEHSIKDEAIHPDAWKVLRRLHTTGHTAYLVGGTVRDLYLGRVPKDFDVATTAKPNDIKRLFRNAFMIGRRFRLAHVKFHDSIIEVATFRRETDRFEEPEEEGGEMRAVRIYGTPEEDARRRDFTINGLFYDPFRSYVIDYVNGLSDLDRRLVRTISPADQSYQEDPARMIRAVRAAARLGFVVEVSTHEAILRHRELILQCPRARLLEELLILMKYGSAERSIRLLWQFGLTEFLLPMHHAYFLRRQQIAFEPPKPDPLFDLLAMLDLETTAVDPAIIFTLLIFPLLIEKLEIPMSEFWTYGRATGSLIRASEDMLNEFGKSVDISKRFRARALEILTVQFRLNIRASNVRPEKVANKPYFADSFRFFQIAARAADVDFKQEISVWEKFRARPLAAKAASIERSPGGPPQNMRPGADRRRRRRRRGRRGPGTDLGPVPQTLPPESPTT